MKILSLNAWGGKLHGQLLPYLSGTKADIICLQEMTHGPETEAEWLTYRDGNHVLAQRANLFRDLCDELPDYVGIFCPAAQGVLWDGELSVPSQWGLATFVRRSIPVIGQVQGFIHKDYSPAGYGDHPRPRNAHGIRVYDYGNDRSVSIVQMHGLRDPNGKQDTPERAIQARRLLDLSKQLMEPSELGVICGDFNIEPSSETLRILANAGWLELVTSGGFKGFQVVRDPEVSDHCPLILEI